MDKAWDRNAKFALLSEIGLLWRAGISIFKMKPKSAIPDTQLSIICLKEQSPRLLRLFGCSHFGSYGSVVCGRNQFSGYPLATD
jgi:hypothetical protein